MDCATTGSPLELTKAISGAVRIRPSSPRRRKERLLALAVYRYLSRWVARLAAPPVAAVFLMSCIVGPATADTPVASPFTAQPMSMPDDEPCDQGLHCAAVEQDPYEIHAGSRSEVIAQFTKCPDGSGGCTAWDAIFNYETLDGIVTCFQIAVTRTITLPDWVDVANAPQCLQREWKRYLTALKEHEQWHANTACNGFQGLAEQLIGKTPEQAQTAFDKRKAKVVNAQHVYDSEHTVEFHDPEECNGKCKYLDVDKANCGACGHACMVGNSCCDGSCSDVTSDNENCGKCGAACKAGESCQAGQCKPCSNLDGSECVPECSGFQDGCEPFEICQEGKCVKTCYDFGGDPQYGIDRACGDGDGNFVGCFCNDCPEDGGEQCIIPNGEVCCYCGCIVVVTTCEENCQGRKAGLGGPLGSAGSPYPGSGGKACRSGRGSLDSLPSAVRAATP